MDDCCQASILSKSRCLFSVPFRETSNSGYLTRASRTHLLYDELVLEGVLRTGQGRAAVIKGRDPLDDMEF